ncbi:MAG TPA: radical SAM protein [Elusimicrobiales bacterium]|nr:radical SAM protein [Elusimicrobiales bacterium]
MGAMKANPFAAPNLRAALKAAPRADRAELRRRLARVRWPIDRKPKVCEITVNYRCNLRCLFCYNPADFHASDRPEVDLRTIARALRAGREGGAWIASLIGGEPTLRRDLPEIARLARRLGYSLVKVCTNSVNFSDPSLLPRLADAGVNMLDVSLHGPSAAVHDRLVGVKGAFDGVLRTVRAAQAAGMEVGVDQVVNRLNCWHFPGFFRLVFEELGVNYYNIIYGHYAGLMAGNARLLRTRISSAVPYVRRGLALIADSGLPAFARMVVNFPPCLMPEYLNVMADWELPAPDEAQEEVMLPDGTVRRLQDMKAEGSEKTRGCRGCLLYERCKGVEKSYLELYGGAEFRAIRKLPRQALSAAWEKDGGKGRKG